jgi:hydroxyacylglutathione hydrolase
VHYDFAQKHNAEIVGVIETHPHADFVSSHLEIHQKFNVPIYSSSLTKAQYPLTAFDEGGIIRLSDRIVLRSLYTPGHAPDHIAAVLSEDAIDKVVFSGDSLFLGDVGRPDLLDFSKESDRQRMYLAGLMYDTIHEKFAKLNDNVVVYPSHRAGSLCGKSIRKAASSTIGYEKQTNYAFQKRTKDEFVNLLLSDQPFIPKYFAYDVRLNHHGAPELKSSIDKIKYLPKNYQPVRMFDAQTGRFFTTDRFSEKTLSLTPYQFTSNNPINYTDYNGDFIIVSGQYQVDGKPMELSLLYEDGKVYYYTMSQDQKTVTKGEEFTGSNEFID